MQKYKRIIFGGVGVLVFVFVVSVVLVLFRKNELRIPTGELELNSLPYSLQAGKAEVGGYGYGLSEDRVGGNSTDPAVEVSAETLLPVSADTPVQSQVMRNAYISIRVKNADEAVAKIRGVAGWYKGKVSSVSISEGVMVEDKGIKSGSVTIQVPTESFDSAVSGVKEVASLVESESITNEDVTAQFVDTDARLKNKKAEEEAFVKILEKAEKTTDIIAVTRELSRVRGEIEVMEGQLRYMSSQTEMATITIQLSEDQNIVAPVQTWRPWQEMKDSLGDLLASLQKFASFTITALFWFLPLAIVYGAIAGVIWFVGRGVYKKIKNKK